MEVYRFQYTHPINTSQLALVDYVDKKDSKVKLGFVFAGDRIESDDPYEVYDEKGILVEYSDLSFSEKKKHFYIYKPAWSPNSWTVNIVDTNPLARC